MIWALLSLASAAEYRHMTLVDGRDFVAEVLVSGDRGMEVAIPQGNMRVGFTDILTMTPATEAQWHAQRPWRLLIAPMRPVDGVAEATAEGADRGIRQALSDIPAVTVLPPPSEAEAFGLRACGLDLGCARSAIPARDIDVLVAGVVGNPTGTAVELSLASIWVANPSASRRASVLQAPGVARFAELSEVDAAAHAVLGLVPAPLTPSPSVVAVAPEAVHAVNPALHGGLVYVPVPGWPAFKSGKPELGVAAWAIAVPLAGTLTWLSGEAAHEPAEFAVATAVSSYVSIVLANAITEPHPTAAD